MLQGSVRSAFRLAALRGASHVWSAAPVFKSAHPRYFSAIPGAFPILRENGRMREDRSSP
jgi:hypothetical protein